MTLSMYDASIPVFIRGLTSLSDVLKKAQANVVTRKIDPSVLLNDRLAPDMFPLTRQVQIATDGVKGCAARLAGVEVPSYADTETTFEQLQERIAKTIAFLQTITAKQLEGSAKKTIQLKVGPNELNMAGDMYLLGFALPNLYFHTTTAYAILRHNGVDIGKQDYLGADIRAMQKKAA